MADSSSPEGRGEARTSAPADKKIRRGIQYCINRGRLEKKKRGRRGPRHSSHLCEGVGREREKVRVLHGSAKKKRKSGIEAKERGGGFKNVRRSVRRKRRIRNTRTDLHPLLWAKGRGRNVNQGIAYIISRPGERRKDRPPTTRSTISFRRKKKGGGRRCYGYWRYRKRRERENGAPWLRRILCAEQR